MTRRQLYQFVADNAGHHRFLQDCGTAMRLLRDMPAKSPAGARRLLSYAPFAQVLKTDDALGRIYQAMNAPALEAAYRRTRDGTKFADEEIPAVTQLFTPRFVVEFLLEHTLRRGRLSEHATAKLVRDIRILDPACGTMNFGLVAIEMLTAMYCREMDHAGRRGWPVEPSVACEKQIPQAIIQHNLFGNDIDPVAIELAAQTLEMKLRTPLNRKRIRLQLRDSLVDGDDQRDSFDVVVTNPPYLSARNLPPERVRVLKRKYPSAWRDEYACFLLRCLQFARDGGRAGLLTMHSFMFTGAFEPLRREIFQSAAVEEIAHFGPGLFDIGNPGTLQTVATVLRRECDATVRATQQVRAIRLVDAADKSPTHLRAWLRRKCEPDFAATDASSWATPMHVISQWQLSESPRAAWLYWLTPQIRRVFATFPKLDEIAPPRQGLATTDNARFVRYWWEVEPTTPDAPCRATAGKWRPYAKGGRFRRWHESPRHRVDWLDDGSAIKAEIVRRYPYLNGEWKWVAKNSAFYGRGGVTYSYLTSGRFSARRLEQGSIFDVAGSSLFPDDPLTMLAVLNSCVAQQLLSAINPTVNYQVGDLKQLPVPARGTDDLRRDVTCAIELQKRLDAFDETSPDFVAPMDWQAADTTHAEIHSQLAMTERRIEQQVARLYELDFALPATAIQAADAALNRVDLARRWVSFALRRVLASRRLVRPADDAAILQIRMELAKLTGNAAPSIEQAVGGLQRFLDKQFFNWHAQLHHRRPVVWQLNGALLLHDHLTPATLQQIGITARWQRCVDDGVQVNLAPLWPWIGRGAMQNLLRWIEAELHDGRFGWSRTAGFSRASTREFAASRGCRRQPRVLPPNAGRK